MRRLHRLAAALSLSVVPCLSAARAQSPAVANRSILLDTANRFWKTRAPESFTARVETSKGTFILEIDRDWAPRGADRFYNLARAGYYDDSRFQRIVPKYIAQFGIACDPALNGVWSTAVFPDDSVSRHNARGTIGFAALGPGARTTQLYINLADNTRIDPQRLTPIGRVVEGMAVVDSLYGGYGETSGGGIRAGKQGPLLTGGNAYIDRQFPKLDRLVRIVISERK
jgi:cyclophilin family peptidyl-prolyl cis-trans isomerase